MLKFFRRIRHDLMATGKTTKYFKYAIGEIVLVVVGILIALQINNWNEKNKQREHQIDQLSNLRTEVMSMKEFFGVQIKILEDAKRSNGRFLKLMDSDTSNKISPDSINSLVGGAMNTDLVTSEKLSLETKIDFKLLPEGKYAQLNEQLLDWRHFTGRIGADFQLIENNRERDLQKAMIDAGVPGWMVLFTNFKPSNFLIDYQALLRSKEVFAVLYYRQVRLEMLINDLNHGLDELDRMLSVLELELKRK